MTHPLDGRERQWSELFDSIAALVVVEDSAGELYRLFADGKACCITQEEHDARWSAACSGTFDEAREIVWPAVRFKLDLCETCQGDGRVGAIRDCYGFSDGGRLCKPCAGCGFAWRLPRPWREITLTEAFALAGARGAA